MDDSRSLPSPLPPNPGPTTHRPALPDSDKRETLLIKLLFDAKRLADSLLGSAPESSSPVRLMRCSECGGFVPASRPERGHTWNCHTGEVLGDIAKLLESHENPLPGAGLGESPCAADEPACASPYAAPDPEPNYFEPWVHHHGGIAKDGADREVYNAAITDAPEMELERYARRIAACVNVCQGSSTESLETAREAMVQAGANRWRMKLTAPRLVMHVLPARQEGGAE